MTDPGISETFHNKTKKKKDYCTDLVDNGISGHDWAEQEVGHDDHAQDERKIVEEEVAPLTFLKMCHEFGLTQPNDHFWVDFKNF